MPAGFAPSWPPSPRHGMLHLDRLTVSGETIGEICKSAANYNREVIRPLDNPLTPEGGIAILRGNLAPSGAVIKPSAATPALMQHSGTRGRLREHRALSRAHRRPRSRHRRDLGDGAEELRPQGLSGHGRGRQYAAAGQAAEEGRHRHGAHLRCADERHGLWHRRAAYRAGGGGGRAARAGAGRRHDRARRGGTPAASRRLRERACRAPARAGRRRSRPWRAAISGSMSSGCCRPTAAAISISWSASAAPRCRAIRTEAGQE